MLLQTTNKFLRQPLQKLPLKEAKSPPSLPKYHQDGHGRQHLQFHGEQDKMGNYKSPQWRQLLLLQAYCHAYPPERRLLANL